jgi:hypothetical protein
MHHEVAPFHRGIEGLLVADVSGDFGNLAAFGVIERRNVIADDSMTAAQQVANEVYAQKAGTTGDEDASWLHGVLLARRQLPCGLVGCVFV